MRAAEKAAIAAAVLTAAVHVVFAEDPRPGHLIARAYDSGFAEAHDTYNGIGTAFAVPPTTFNPKCSAKLGHER